MEPIYTVINNENDQRFEVHEGRETAYLEYRYYKKDLALITLLFLNTSKEGVLPPHWHIMPWSGREHIKNR